MKGNFKPKSMKNTIKLFLAAAVVALAASCSSNSSESANDATPQEEPATPAEATVHADPDSVEISSRPTQVAQYFLFELCRRPLTQLSFPSSYFFSHA